MLHQKVALFLLTISLWADDSHKVLVTSHNMDYKITLQIKQQYARMYKQGFEGRYVFPIVY